MTALCLYRKNSDCLVLTIGSAFRISFAIVVTTLLIALIVFPAKEVPVPGIITIAISLLAMLYEERWIFDRASGEIRHRFGLIILHRTHTLRMADIEELTLVSIIHGKRALTKEGRAPYSGRRYTILSLSGSGATKTTVEVAKNRNPQKLLEKGRAIAELCGVPLREVNSTAGHLA